MDVIDDIAVPLRCEVRQSRGGSTLRICDGQTKPVWREPYLRFPDTAQLRSKLGASRPVTKRHAYKVYVQRHLIVLSYKQCKASGSLLLSLKI